MWGGGRKRHRCIKEEKGRRRREERRRQKKKQTFLRMGSILAVGALLFLASAAATGAYLTGSPEILLNRIVSGQVAVELTEPAWNPEKKIHMLPQTSTPKNPMAKNTGTLESWIFMKVEIPIEKISIVSTKTGRKQEKTKTELFNFTPSEDWELLSREVGDSAACYLYGYRKTLKPLEKTTPLFSQITMVNYLEGELDADRNLQISAEAMSIQSSVCEEGTSLQEIYQIYENSRA